MTGDVREGLQPEAPQSHLKSAAPLARRHCEEGLREQGCLLGKRQPGIVKRDVAGMQSQPLGACLGGSCLVYRQYRRQADLLAPLAGS